MYRNWLSKWIRYGLLWIKLTLQSYSADKVKTNEYRILTIFTLYQIYRKLICLEQQYRGTLQIYLHGDHIYTVYKNYNLNWVKNSSLGGYLKIM